MQPAAAAPARSRADTMIERAYGAGPSLSQRFRANRFRKLLPLIDAIIEEKGHCRVIDVGGTQYYWDIVGDFVESRPIEITLVNQELSTASGKFHSVIGDATNLTGIADNSFDFAHSNSVIEHVGDWRAMRAAANEIRRVAPAYYVQTPNFWFPYEPHFRCAFFHWLPEHIRYRLVMRFALGFADRKKTVHDAMARVQSARLIDQMQMRELFPEAEHSCEWVMGLPKSLIAAHR